MIPLIDIWIILSGISAAQAGPMRRYANTTSHALNAMTGIAYQPYAGSPSLSLAPAHGTAVLPSSSIEATGFDTSRFKHIHRCAQQGIERHGYHCGAIPIPASRIRQRRQRRSILNNVQSSGRRPSHGFLDIRKPAHRHHRDYNIDHVHHSISASGSRGVFSSTRIDNQPSSTEYDGNFRASIKLDVRVRSFDYIN
jgi:hypothetical protein